ncbi:glycosyltransferase [Fulvivirga sediminis]|uniref:Glycosyltransferase n=1 Tax=Fulvivirga sediminis TaxID=2803949 RepID=A0A937F7A2_9BACT|nr:glycosyltransferase [Fulvivirga sediminis]MBL3655635.1 glycosyltransferase [Fulvivirga sediminis]
MLAIAGVIILYNCLLLIILLAWNSIKIKQDYKKQSVVKFSVIIPFRNEAKRLQGLLHSFKNLNYNKDHFEIIFINDHSTDSSVSVVADFAKSSALNVSQYNLQEEHGKKAAIRLGISNSSYDYIITTDADCSFEPGWLQSYAQQYVITGDVLVFGPVTFYNESTFFEKLQTIEFASLIGTGAASLQLKKPNMCNGANFSFKKEAFYQVGGYEGNEQLASGDDEFLMHKIYNFYEGGVSFNKDQDAIVKTLPLRGWREFYHQRKRWASKWKKYTRFSTILTALFVAAANLAVLIGVALVIINFEGYSWLLFPLLLKVFLEGLFIGRVMFFFKKSFNVFHFIVLELSYPVYALFFGIAANFGTYIWKDRRH